MLPDDIALLQRFADLPEDRARAAIADSPSAAGVLQHSIRAVVEAATTAQEPLGANALSPEEWALGRQVASDLSPSVHGLLNLALGALRGAASGETSPARLRRVASLIESALKLPDTGPKAADDPVVSTEDKEPTKP